MIEESKPNYEFIFTSYAFAIPVGISGWGTIVSTYLMIIESFKNNDVGMVENGYPPFSWLNSILINGIFFLVSLTALVGFFSFQRKFYLFKKAVQKKILILSWSIVLIVSMFDLYKFF